MAPQLAAGEHQHFSYDVVDVECDQLRFGLLGEGPQPSDHVARAPRADDHLFDRAARLIESRRLAVEPSEARVAKGNDARERLVDFVGDRGRQLPQGGQPRGVGELRLRDPKRLFGALAFGDVDRDPTKLVRAPRHQRPQGLRDVDLAAWRRRIAYLPSHPTLLGSTLAENLRLANPNAGNDELIDALRAVGATELLAALPSGLSTPLGDGGRPTSAGELQRIALARVLLRPASLYLLDEPTVHLDEDGEAVALEALRDVLVGRSALIVTHRPAVMRIAHRIVTLRDGTFVPGPAGAAIDHRVPA